jgi:hypothetical protein
MNNIHVIYHQNMNYTFDAYIKGAKYIKAVDSRDLSEARTFVRVLFEWEVGPCRIVKETINYIECR